jgi:hypothetical protein
MQRAAHRFRRAALKAADFDDALGLKVPNKREQERLCVAGDK